MTYGDTPGGGKKKAPDAVSDYKKPLPNPSLNPEVSKPFWDGTKKHELWVQYDRRNNKFVFPPREVSPGDLTPMDELEWTKINGMGRVYSYTTVYQSSIPAFTEEAPYVNATIQLDAAGVRMTGNVLGLTKEQLMNNELHINQRVEAVFEDITPDWTLVKWQIVDEEEAPSAEE
jgi:uncharacterized OB-fold protein